MGVVILIFVILGTQDKTFPRLIEKIEDQIKKKNIKEEVIVQSGQTKYESDLVKVLWNWDFSKKLTFTWLEKYSKSALNKIEKAGAKIN